MAVPGTFFSISSNLFCLDGTLKTEALETLDKLSPKEENKESEDIDPRWENLKKLLTDK